MKKARLIYNPTSGHEMMKKNVADILYIMEQAGYEASAYQTTPEKLSAQKEATRVGLAGFDLVVAAGGDGTLNEVINGIAPLAKRPKMAIIPAGTTNDYARALKIPREDPVAAAKVILQNERLKVDIGQANENYFMNIAGGGLLTELTYDVPSQLKSIFGYLAYIVKGAEYLPRIKPINMHLEYDDGVYDGTASMFLLGLTNSIGGFENIAPDAQLDDGKFSLIVVKTANLAEMLHLMALVINGGKHVNDKRIIYTKTSKLVAKTDDDQQMMINLDGEYGGDAPMTFINHQQHIEMFVNKSAIPDKALSSETADEKAAEDSFVKEVENMTEQDIDGDGKIGK